MLELAALKDIRPFVARLFWLDADIGFKPEAARGGPPA